MNKVLFLFLFFPFLFFGQVPDAIADSTDTKFLIIKGDSIPRTAIDLEEVMLLHKLKFTNKKSRIRYLILRRKTLKVFPYAKMAADKLDSLTISLASMNKEREKNKHTKKTQKFIEGEFSDELKKMTRTEGQILVKLIHRQTGKTTFDLVKELRTGWKAFWYNTTANMFDISLKEEFDPVNIKEDYLIEDILQRSFQNGLLERQNSAKRYDFYDLAKKWVENK